MNDYSGYGWIKVQRYEMDETKTWEERYRELEGQFRWEGDLDELRGRVPRS